MSDLAASGGYFISLTGDPILAYPGTITGSIGVIYGKINFRGLYDKIGIQKELLTRGRFADIDSDYRELSPEGREKLRGLVYGLYQSFVRKVAEARKRKYDEVEPLAQGRAWLGAQAKENGLVDELGGLDRAIDRVKERAKIPANEQVRLVVYPPRMSLLEHLLQRSSESGLNARLRSLLGGIDPRLLQQGGFLKVMPYSIRVR
jgi:protease-4